MEPQYNMIRDEVAKGNTVLCYNRKTVLQRIRRINAHNFAKRVGMVERALTVDGILAMGWTFAVHHKTP